MSQQINLILPALRPRFDWLALPVVAGLSLAGILFMTLLTVLGYAQVVSLKTQQETLKSQLQALQQQAQSLGATLAARQGDASLDGMIGALQQGVTQRQEVLAVIVQGDNARGGAYSSLLDGFARQIVEGVWLTGFRFDENGIGIHGRLLDPALLPAYIGRLNGETAFAGRRFSALDMKGVDPAAEEKRNASPAATAPRPSPRYTEFALRAEPVVGQEKAR